MDDKAESGAKAKGKRLDLSVAQVAGSALAAVIAALLAGKLGVYGTVIGAGVVSVVATTGGTVFHHLFRRTGEQVRDAAVQAARPRLRQVPLGDAERAVGRARAADASDAAAGHPGAALPPDPDRTELFARIGTDRDEDATRMLPEAHAGAYPGAYASAHSVHGSEAFSGEFSAGTTHGTRWRGWKRPFLAAGAVFVLAMGAVTAVELVSGQSADGTKGGTTIMRSFQQDGQKKPKGDDKGGTGGEHGRDGSHGTGSGTDEGADGSQDPSRSPGTGGSGTTDGQDGKDDGTGKGDATPSPDASRPAGGSGGQTPDPGKSPSGGSTPSPDRTPDPGGSPDAGKGGTAEGKGGASAPPAQGKGTGA
ncbi:MULTISPECIES: ICP22 family protein [Streptomyces]|uniref:hypothetical protein n=1 Tax=Streptomyces TaxID=1883 RepID=UPI00163C948A|nr:MULTISPECIES: hypothetical protein [Streptomyces]MBC2876750.1 hypothetical protein [Streptomyces sp. TYQ1024]UBI36378.1 hypothetical protein K7I03_07800 [Streptomyces mobaraensis]UKW28972.1 hypothetical protein MCU78_07785 [Streptomyces sp. TYQ1024]